MHTPGLGDSKYVQPPMVGTTQRSCYASQCCSEVVRGLYDSLGEESMDTYTHLKSALLQCLCPDTEEDCLAASEQLSKRKLQEGREGIDEVVCDLEKLLDKACPGLPAKIQDTELRYHLINSLPE